MQKKRPNMKVFISCSETRSRLVAKILREKLPYILQELEPFLSENDIQSGERWAQRLAKELDSTEFGILCLTPENCRSEWLLFEAGALTKHADGRACSILFGDLSMAQVPSPLQQFQNHSFNRDRILQLVRDLNKELRKPLGEKQLDSTFDKQWPDIESCCNQAMQAEIGNATSPPDLSKLVQEVVLSVRRIESRITTAQHQEGKNRPNINHFYTADKNEAARALHELGYLSEGVACYALLADEGNTVPLHRLRSDNLDDHFYTISDSEKSKALQLGEYRDEGIACWVPQNSVENAVPFYAMFHEGYADHFYTTDPSERDRASREHGYEDLGIVCYVFPEPIGNSVPVFRLINYANRD